MSEERTVYVTSLHDKVDKPLLEEIFTQVGPLDSVSIRANNDSKYAFVEFTDEESVLFACKTLDGLRLYKRAIQVKPRNNSEQARKWQEQRRSLSNNNRNPRYEDHDRDRRDDRRDSYNRGGPDNYSRGGPDNYSRGGPDVYSDYRPNPRYQQQYETPPVHVPQRHSHGASAGGGGGRPMHSYKPYARDSMDDNSWRGDSRRSSSGNNRSFDLYRGSDGGSGRQQHQQQQRGGRKVFNNSRASGGGGGRRH
uniref:RRM domain-containing protein n=1 Tax=Panagrellus redivivus TaxID=6233 RepID=A0A7E4ZVN8_PANRE